MSFNRKDAVLDRLAEHYNVAQFVSFEPQVGKPTQRFSRILGRAANHAYASPGEGVVDLLGRSNSGSVNIRSFAPSSTQSMEFIYGITSADEVLSHMNRLSTDGAHCIVNETIDVSDGGVSGVALRNLVEFRPDATPRGVESPGFASLPINWAKLIFSIVYGFEPDLDEASEGRLEFSVHPRRIGWLHRHTVYWEYERTIAPPAPPNISVEWPNDFSRMLGDKVYGLLIAHAVGERVPMSTVVNRRVAPFTFGVDTNCSERWLRTAPFIQQPGKFTTVFGWRDPFALLSAEDVDGTNVASVISQSAVDAKWSGAALTKSSGRVWVEGVSGSGDEFMLGLKGPENLPESVELAVREAYRRMALALGPVRFEWAHDGLDLWILQLHRGVSSTNETHIVPGEPVRWVQFSTSSGLEDLRTLIGRLEPGTGIALRGAVGLTSHIADVLRKANVPAKFM